MKIDAMPEANGPGWVLEHGTHTYMLWAPRPATDIRRARETWQLHHCRTLDAEPYSHQEAPTAAAVLRTVRADEVRTALERAIAGGAR